MLEALNNALTAALGQRSALALGIAFLLGLFVGFSPCVYPVLPLTVAYIGSVSKGRKINGFLYSLVYVLGMAIVYCTIGVISATVGGGLRRLWGNGWVLLAFANFFLLLALWQLGVIRIRLPQFSGGSRKKGALGALGVGAASGLIVGPCTVPGLAAMLALINAGAGQGAGVGSLLFGILAMFAYSLGLGSLILICGTFSGVLANLPKSGRWLNVMEKAFAVLMILLAEYFLIYLGHTVGFPKLPTFSASRNAESPRVLQIGQAAPEWSLKDSDGGVVNLSQFKEDKGVIMVFFATWCPVCMDEVPQLIALQDSYSNRRVALLAVNVQEPPGTVQGFIDDRGVNYKVLLDEDGAVSAKYGLEVTGLPMIAGIDSGGIVRYLGAELPKDLDSFISSLEPAGNATDTTRSP